jgi:hypothetical protein
VSRERDRRNLEIKMKDFRIELKVCEACGALWLRSVGAGAYCLGCAQWLSEFPTVRSRTVRFERGKGVRRPARHGIHVCQAMAVTASAGGGR